MQMTTKSTRTEWIYSWSTRNKLLAVKGKMTCLHNTFMKWNYKHLCIKKNTIHSNVFCEQSVVKWDLRKWREFPGIPHTSQKVGCFTNSHFRFDGLPVATVTNDFDGLPVATVTNDRCCAQADVVRRHVFGVGWLFNLWLWFIVAILSIHRDWSL